MVGFPDLALAPNAIISTTQDTGVPCRSPRGRRRGDRARLAGPGRGRRGRVDAGLPGPHASAWPSGCAADPGKPSTCCRRQFPSGGRRASMAWSPGPATTSAKSSAPRAGWTRRWRPTGRRSRLRPHPAASTCRPPARGTWARQLVHGRLCLTSVPSSVGVFFTVRPPPCYIRHMANAPNLWATEEDDDTQQIGQLLGGWMATQVVRTVALLGIPDQLAASPRTAQVARSTNRFTPSHGDHRMPATERYCRRANQRRPAPGGIRPPRRAKYC